MKTVLDVLRDNNFQAHMDELAPIDWTNNAAESWNHKLREMTEYQPKTATRLAEILADHFRIQKANTMQALTGQGKQAISKLNCICHVIFK